MTEQASDGFNKVVPVLLLIIVAGFLLVSVADIDWENPFNPRNENDLTLTLGLGMFCCGSLLLILIIGLYVIKGAVK